MAVGPPKQNLYKYPVNKHLMQLLMKTYRILIFLLLVCISTYHVACTKIAPITPTDTTTTTIDTTATLVKPTVKFFNVMDYGNIAVTFNKVNLGEVALYYPYPANSYTNGIIGTNNIVVKFGGETKIDVNVDLLANKSYSIFVYRVGYDWKLSVVTDDLTLPGTGKAKVRVLDFRTQAYFDYVKVKFSSLGSVDTLRYNNRNFLDHASYDTYTKFNTLPSGSYNMVIFNDTANLANRTSLQLSSNKIYSMIMVTKASLESKDAIYQINIDWKVNK